MTQRRHYRGSPTGGQFAASPRAEAVGVELDESTSAEEDMGSEHFADEAEERAAWRREERSAAAETNAVLMEIAGAAGLSAQVAPPVDEAPSSEAVASPGSYPDEFEEQAARHRRREEAKAVNDVLMGLAAERRRRPPAR